MVQRKLLPIQVVTVVVLDVTQGCGWKSALYRKTITWSLALCMESVAKESFKIMQKVLETRAKILNIVV